MSSQLNEFLLFLGPFHPMLVHLPIGGLVLLGGLELLAGFPRFKDAAQNRRLILAVVLAGSAGSVACGWLLAQSGGYEAQLLFWHRWTGIAFAAACVVVLWLARPGRLAAYRLALLMTLILLVVAGHFGSEITHGRDFLSHYAPAPLRALLGLSASSKAAAAPADFRQRQLYAEVIRPILQNRCTACHGPEKRKGNLDLDNLANAKEGGENGPAFVAGKADESLIIERILLPLEDEEHMPPDGKPQATAAEIGLLRWWINLGAPETGTVSDFKPGADVLRMLERLSARKGPDGQRSKEST
jgi:mono/diheme cytochrome c family protein/uncharacterized membrane protein